MSSDITLADSTATDMPDRILDAAEQVFADRGFAATTTRAIAEAAGANLGLIHYHFGSKERLFEACFRRRADQINQRRRAMLTEAFADGPPPLSRVIEAFIRPSLELGRQQTARLHYARILAVVAAGTDTQSRALTAAYFNGIAQDFIAAIRQLRPGLGVDHAVRGYLFATAISVSMMAATGRAAELSGNRAINADLEALIAETVRFITAGFEAIALPPHDHVRGEDEP